TLPHRASFLSHCPTANQNSTRRVAHPLWAPQPTSPPPPGHRLFKCKKINPPFSIPMASSMSFCDTTTLKGNVRTGLIGGNKVHLLNTFFTSNDGIENGVRKSSIVHIFLLPYSFTSTTVNPLFSKRSRQPAAS